MVDFVTDFSSTVYYPSLVVNFEIRFDEELTFLAAPQSVASLAKTGGAVGTPAVQQPVLASNRKDNKTQILGLVPKTATVELPGFRQAGKFDLVFPFKDFPLDPRVMRACAVSIHMDAIDEKTFGESMKGLSILSDTTGKQRAAVVKPSKDNLVLYGTVDTIDVTYDDSGANVHMEGRDLRGIFLDAAVDPQVLKQIDFKQSIDKIVKRLVNQLVPLGGGVTVTAAPNNEWPSGSVPSPGDAFTRANMNAEGTQTQTAVKGDVNQLKIWDLVTQYCYLVGAIPHFVGQELRIVPAVNIFDVRKQEQTFDLNAHTPFKNDVARLVKPPLTKKAEAFNYRRFVFGRDVLSLKFERKLGGVKVPIVQCISIDPSIKEKGIDPTTGLPKNVLFVEEPPNSTDPKTQKARATTVSPGGKIVQAEPLRIPVPGIKDKNRLRDIAKALRQEIGRQEMGGSISTRNLASFGGDRQDPDLLRLMPGDPVEIRVDSSGLGVFPPPVHELVAHESRSREEEIAAIKERFGNTPDADNLARVIVGVMRGDIVQLQKTFRVGNVKFTWDAKTGIAIDFDFQNYVEARYSV